MTRQSLSRYARRFQPKREFLSWLIAAVLFAGTNATGAPTAQVVRISGYAIDVTLDPAHHLVRERATVTFSVLRDATTISMVLNPALHLDSVRDATGQSIAWTRDSTDPQTIHTTSPETLDPGEAVTWTFTGEGVFPGSPRPAEFTHRTNPPMASIGEPVSYLLYSAHWFPGSRSFADPFSATIHVHVPPGLLVFGSGPAEASHPDGNGNVVFDFHWESGGFPGSLVAGRFRGPFVSKEDPRVRLFLIEKSKTTSTLNGQNYAATAGKIFQQMTAKFGSAGIGRLNIVELPNNFPPAVSAPELAAISGRQMIPVDSYRLLANSIAHQWWGEKVHPATKNDAWITNGMCRLEELAFLQRIVNQETFQDALFNISASALAYDKYPLAQAGRYARSSVEFQSQTYDKGAMVLRMLQWQIGDAAFQQLLREVLQKNDSALSSSQFEAYAEAAYHQNLRPFFTQWLESTGAPTLQDNWTLYRLGGNQGYRTIGEITEDLDLFQMPVEVQIDTNDKTVTRRIAVHGPSTQFVIGDQRVPTKISLDPDRWLLRNSPELQVRVHILRGNQMEATGEDAGAIREYQQALAINTLSSLACFRLAEVYLRQQNYQAAANAYRDALHGDGQPKWTEVWSDLELGEVFDLSGERERAVNQYREALQTGDNSGGALELARSYIEHPYTAPSIPSQ